MGLIFHWKNCLFKSSLARRACFESWVKFSTLRKFESFSHLPNFEEIQDLEHGMRILKFG